MCLSFFLYIIPYTYVCVLLRHRHYSTMYDGIEKKETNNNRTGIKSLFFNRFKINSTSQVHNDRSRKPQFSLFV